MNVFTYQHNFETKKSFYTMTRLHTFFNSSNSELRKVCTLDTEAMYEGRCTPLNRFKPLFGLIQF